MAKTKSRRSSRKKKEQPAEVVPAVGCVGSLDALSAWVGWHVTTLKSWKAKYDSFPVESDGTYRVRDVIEWRLNGFSSSKASPPEEKGDAESKKERFENAKLLEAEAGAIKNLIAVKREARSMISYDDARQFYSSTFAEIRQLLEAVPDELAPEIPEKFTSDIPKKFRHDLTERIRQKLRLILKRFASLDIRDMEVD